MAFKEFTGELDAAPVATPPGGKFREFTGQLDPEPMTDREAFESSLPVRVLRGVEGPAISLLKMVGPDSIKQQLAEIDALRKSGMKKRGDEGFDWAGLVGSLVPGGVIASGVTKALPAATTLLGKMGVGAVAGGASAGAQPLEGNNELSTDKLKQIGAGAAVGATIPAVTQGVKSFFGTNQLNPTQAATLKEGQAAGYTVPPTAINPSGLNNIMESIAGKASVGQEAAARNQKITNALTAKDLGVPPNTPITEAVLKQVRETAAEPYRQIASLSPKAADALDKLKQARFDAKEQWNYFNRSGNPEASKAARALDEKISLYERVIDDEAKKIVQIYGVQGSAVSRSANRPQLETRSLATGREAAPSKDTLDVSLLGERTAGPADILDRLRDARQKIAKSYDVEHALNLGDSNVSAPAIGRQLDKAGVEAKSGNLRTIGKVAEAFPNVMREGARVPTSGVDGTNALMSPILAGLGYGAAGPAGTAAAVLPWIARPAARNLVLSKGYQNTLAQGIPARYQPLIDALTQQAIGAGGTTAGRAY